MEGPPSTLTQVFRVGEAIVRVVGALKGAQQVPWLTGPCAGPEEGAGILNRRKRKRRHYWQMEGQEQRPRDREALGPT